MTERHLSQHPVDVLIRQIVVGGRRATGSDVEQIIERIATAPFDPRLKTVPEEIPVRDHGGRPMQSLESALLVHLLTRVYLDGQWTTEVSPDSYLADLRAVVRFRQARLGLFVRRGGAMAAVIADTKSVVSDAHLGVKHLDLLIVLYSADRGIIVSGYQFSKMSMVAMPEDIQWLK